MKFVLVSDPHESPAFEEFLYTYSHQHNTDEKVTFMVLGGMLNFFPDLTSIEQLQRSLCFEHYPEVTAEGAEALRNARGRQSFMAGNPLSHALKGIIYPTGLSYTKAMRSALVRYMNLYKKWVSCITENCHIVVVPGPYDYAMLSELASLQFGSITQLDYNQPTVVVDGVSIGAIGGGVSSVGLLSGELLAKAPNEVVAEEFGKRLKSLEGCDVLASAVSPTLIPEFENYVKASLSVKLIMSPAIMDYSKDHNPRGDNELVDIGGACCIRQRQFDLSGTAYVIDILPGKLSSRELPVEMHTWHTTGNTHKPADTVDLANLRIDLATAAAGKSKIKGTESLLASAKLDTSMEPLTSSKIIVPSASSAAKGTTARTKKGEEGESSMTTTNKSGTGATLNGSKTRSSENKRETSRTTKGESSTARSKSRPAEKPVPPETPDVLSDVPEKTTTATTSPSTPPSSSPAVASRKGTFETTPQTTGPTRKLKGSGRKKKKLIGRKALHRLSRRMERKDSSGS